MNDTYTASGYPTTAVMTRHARERCAQMKIRTREIKRLWRERGVVRTVRNDEGRVIVTSPAVPGYAAVMDLRGDKPLVVTVFFDEVEDYIRDDNGGYTLVGER